MKKTIKMKKGDTVFCHKVFDKRPVTMLSSRHNAVKSFVKDNYLGHPITKPVVIQQYNQFMGGVDNSDNLLTGYLSLKSFKWY